MTKEEQIAELIRHRNEVQNDFGWNTTLLSSLDAAIEALKAQPSKEEMIKIDKLCEDAYEHGYQQARYDYEAQSCEKVVSLDGVINTIEWYRTNPQHFTEDNLVEDIKGLPPVIPKPKTGHWIDDCPIMTDEGLVRVIRCSCCNEQRKDYYGVSKNYCPKCGVKMEGENNAVTD